MDRGIQFVINTVTGCQPISKVATHVEDAGGPLPEGLILAAHFVAGGKVMDSFPAEVAQQFVHVLAEIAEVRIRARA